jgi:RNase P/RNase MRP subunit p29
MTEIRNEWVGLKVEQVRYEHPEYASCVGRTGTVVDSTVDEKGQVHLLTDDNMWCPLRLMSVI